MGYHNLFALKSCDILFLLKYMKKVKCFSGCSDGKYMKKIQPHRFEFEKEYFQVVVGTLFCY